ncbi:DUF5989 family protein [Sediminibacterium soli]
MHTLKDVFQFLRQRRKLWLAPVILALLLVAILVVLGAGSAFAPFVYTLF